MPTTTLFLFKCPQCAGERLATFRHKTLDGLLRVECMGCRLSGAAVMMDEEGHWKETLIQAAMDMANARPTHFQLHVSAGALAALTRLVGRGPTTVLNFPLAPRLLEPMSHNVNLVPRLYLTPVIVPPRTAYEHLLDD